MLQLPEPGTGDYVGQPTAGMARPLAAHGLEHVLGNATLMRETARLLSTTTLMIEGVGVNGFCGFTAPLSAPSLPVIPPWTNAVGSSGPVSLSLCLGGHNTSCDVEALTCGGLAEPMFHNFSDPTVAACVNNNALGSSKAGTPATWTQFGYASMATWWKPCPGCAVGSSGGACDADACRANVTQLLQRRAVVARRVPSPGVLAALQEADGRAFSWYACRPTSAASYMSGYPAPCVRGGV